jgi:hypothetical protein
MPRQTGVLLMASRALRTPQPGDAEPRVESNLRPGLSYLLDDAGPLVPAHMKVYISSKVTVLSSFFFYSTMLLLVPTHENLHFL